MGSEHYSGVWGWFSDRGKGDQYPAYEVSWDDCQKFIVELNAQLKDRLPAGYHFALPTEAQWEYAARGGKNSQHYKYSYNTVGNVAWYDENSGSSTHPVKTKAANEIGLYDIIGNVSEWCADWYGSYSSSSQTNPTGPYSGSYRVKRGGSWNNNAWSCRVAKRDNAAPDKSYDSYGFRLSLVP